MQDSLYFAWYSQHFVIPANNGPYPAISNKTSSPQWAELEAAHKYAKKAYGIAITLQTILWNQLINAVPDDYHTELWDPDEGYSQSAFRDIIFDIFDQYTLINYNTVGNNKFLYDQPMDISKPLAIYFNQ